MEQATKAAIDDIVAREPWTIEDQKVLVGQLHQTQDSPRKLRAALEGLESAEPQPRGAAALKIGILNYMLCRFNRSLDVLTHATDNKERRYFQAMCFKSLKQYEKAVEDFERAKDRGFDADVIQVQLAEIKALMGDLDGARKLLSKMEKQTSVADMKYLQGLVEELAGYGEKAAGLYEAALAADGNHSHAKFRLAYYLDLHGEEEQAVELYRQCLNIPPVHANALLNLSILYEDAGRYDQAVNCLRRIMATMPSHPRARLYLKDVEASDSMYYDEDQAKRVARRNAVLDIPVTDFELSVRARNCLKKMNVRSLGDLARTTESDLLGYKNFGETSLKEIKDMLSIKGLRLGQALEDEEVVRTDNEIPVSAVPVHDAGILGTPIAQLEFSIRARKALENLRIGTLGDLSSKSEAELLACKNFGQTSLNEVLQRLGEHGLRLREPM